jgi:hypothetical protein
MDYSSSAIRSFNVRRLRDVMSMLETREGCTKIADSARVVLSRGGSRCKLIRHFGILAARESNEVRALKQIYILADAEAEWETTNHADFIADPNSFYIAATWMRLTDLVQATNETAVVGASVRVFPRYAIWPHALAEIAMRVEDHVLDVFTERDGLDAPSPTGLEMSTLVAVTIVLSAVQALKCDLSRCSSDYVRWEALVLAYNANAITKHGMEACFHRLPVLVDMLGFTDVLSVHHYEITRQFRVSYESLTVNTDRLRGNTAALHKLVSSLRGDAATERAEDGSLTWHLGAADIQKFMGRLFTETCRQRYFATEDVEAL